MSEFKFPDVGEGITEGKLIKWMVKEGDTVKEDQVLAEVETDKAVVEVPSPQSGKITKLHASAGSVIKVGQTLVTFDGGAVPKIEPAKEAPKEPAKEPVKEVAKEPVKEPVKPKLAQPVQQKEPVQKPAEQPVQKEAKVNAGVTPSSDVEKSEKTESKSERPVQQPTQAIKRQAGQRVLATPHTRRLARELGIDISTIQGSGPAGRITDEDLKGGKKIAAPTTPGTPTPSTPALTPTTIADSGPGKREPMSSIRKAIANKMVESESHAVHVTHCDEVDVTELVAFRNKEKAMAKKKGVKLTYLPFIAKAALSALTKFPMFNASLDESTNEIVFKDYYHLGMALATEYGLIVPVIKNANDKSILDLGREMHELADRGRAKRLKPDEISGSTFTITNVGSIGGTVFTPILNYPESGILGVGRIQQLPRVIDDKIVIRHILHLSFSFDHRIGDGAEAARFVNEIKAMLEDPDLLLLEST